MFCENCGSSLNGTDAFCQNCGTPVHMQPASSVMESQSEASVETPVEASAETAAEISAEAAAQPSAEAAAATAYVSQAETTDAASEAAAPTAPTAPEPEAAAPGATGFDAQDAAAPQKGLPKFLIPAVVVVAIVAVVICTFPYLGNFFAKTFSKPEKYYQHVETKTMDDLASSLSSVYGNQILNNMELYDRSVTSDVNITLGEDGKALLRALGISGIDMSWLKKAGISSSVSMGGDSYNGSLALSLNGTGIATLNQAMDLKNGAFYFQIPEINSYYIGVEDDSIAEEMEESSLGSDGLKAFYKSLPTQAVSEKMIKKYTNLVLKNITDVENKGKGKVKVSKIEQSATKLIVTIDGDTMQSIYEDVLTEASKDADLKKIIISAAELSGEEDGEEAYDEFLEEIDHMLDNLDYLSESKDKLKMTVYVDAKGNIIGREFKMAGSALSGLGSSNSDQTALEYKHATKGGKTAYEYSYTDYRGKVSEFVATGKKSGDKFTGDYEISVEGNDALKGTVSNLDIAQLKKGFPNGAFTVELGKSLASELGSSSLSKFSLSCTVKSSKDNYKASVTVFNSKDSKDGLVTIDMTAKTASGKKNAVPAAKNVVVIEDIEDLDDWLDGLNTDAFVKSLQKADLPEEWVDAIDDVLEDVDDSSDLMQLLRLMGISPYRLGNIF